MYLKKNNVILYNLLFLIISILHCRYSNNQNYIIKKQFKNIIKLLTIKHIFNGAITVTVYIFFQLKVRLHGSVTRRPLFRHSTGSSIVPTLEKTNQMKVLKATKLIIDQIIVRTKRLQNYKINRKTYSTKACNFKYKI